jgi:3-hydroxyisobutyrate dehydrogenase-like beta-hydroxyacid dehydrogenase
VAVHRLEKDLELALAACGETSRELPLTDLVRGLYIACAERGWAERDFACLDELYHDAPGPVPGARTLTEDQCR